MPRRRTRSSLAKSMAIRSRSRNKPAIAASPDAGRPRRPPRALRRPAHARLRQPWPARSLMPACPARPVRPARPVSPLAAAPPRWARNPITHVLARATGLFRSRLASSLRAGRDRRRRPALPGPALPRPAAASPCAACRLRCPVLRWPPPARSAAALPGARLLPRARAWPAARCRAPRRGPAWPAAPARGRRRGLARGHPCAAQVSSSRRLRTVSRTSSVTSRAISRTDSASSSSSSARSSTRFRISSRPLSVMRYTFLPSTSSWVTKPSSSSLASRG